MRYLPQPQSAATKSRPLISRRFRANFRTASHGISRTISPERSSAIFTMKRFSCSSLEIIALVGAFSNAALSVSIASLISSATPSMDLRELSLSDFAALAKAYGGFGTTVRTTEDFVTAYEQAVASGLLSVIELQIDDEVLSTSQTVSEVRNNDK